ncbi:MAG: XisH family protein [Chloroflexi bacterium]|nr:XisH family protein [Chloroflexota bacterium]MBI5080283.1 XisH family protein [Chloroflexota bacterium]MBI5712849.1 XisH family protein [Chloroflexota bacterium]
MSRKDTLHETVKTALIREGWTITHDPYLFDSTPQLSTDLGAERAIAAERGLEKIAVEVKSFLNVSQVVDLERAIGQYELYQHLLQQQEPERSLYVAVPRYAYEGIFSTPVGQIAIEKIGLKLMVFSISGEEELLWTTH